MDRAFVLLWIAMRLKQQQVDIKVKRESILQYKGCKMHNSSNDMTCNKTGRVAKSS